MGKDFVITKKINSILKKKSLTAYRVSKLMGVSDSALYGMIKGDTPFSPDFKIKIAPVLEVPLDAIEGWILADKYPKNLLQKAIQAKQQNPDAEPTIFRMKIDELRNAQNLNMVDFAAAIGYNQGQLSQSSLGKKATSPKLIQKLSNYSNIPEDEIKSWVIADKYSLEALRVAVECIEN